MKKTTIHIRAFDSYFSLTLKRRHYMTLEQCQEYLAADLEWETATIQEIEHGDNCVYMRDPLHTPIQARDYLRLA